MRYDIKEWLEDFIDTRVRREYEKLDLKYEHPKHVEWDELRKLEGALNKIMDEQP